MVVYQSEQPSLNEVGGNAVSGSGTAVQLAPEQRDENGMMTGNVLQSQDPGLNSSGGNAITSGDFAAMSPLKHDTTGGTMVGNPPIQSVSPTLNGAGGNSVPSAGVLRWLPTQTDVTGMAVNSPVLQSVLKALESVGGNAVTTGGVTQLKPEVASLIYYELQVTIDNTGKAAKTGATVRIPITNTTIAKHINNKGVRAFATRLATDGSQDPYLVTGALPSYAHQIGSTLDMNTSNMAEVYVKTDLPNNATTTVWLYYGGTKLNQNPTPSVSQTGTNTGKTLPANTYGMHTTSVSIDGYGYIFGGDGSSNIIRVAPDGSALTVANLPGNRGFAAAATSNSHIYFFGGYSGGATTNTIQRFDPDNNTFTQLGATFPANIYGQVAIRVGGNIYLFGGYTNAAQSTIWKFDIGTETLTTLGVTLPAANWHHTGAYDGSRYIYLFGQNGTTSSTPSIRKFDTQTDTFVTYSGQELPLQVSYSSCAVYNGAAYLVGGVTWNSTRSQSIVKFTFGTEQVTTFASLPESRYGMACNIFGSKLIVMGGHNGSTSKNDSYSYELTNENDLFDWWSGFEGTTVAPWTGITGTGGITTPSTEQAALGSKSYKSNAANTLWVNSPTTVLPRTSTLYEAWSRFETTTAGDSLVHRIQKGGKEWRLRFDIANNKVQYYDGSWSDLGIANPGVWYKFVARIDFAANSAELAVYNSVGALIGQTFGGVTGVTSGTSDTLQVEHTGTAFTYTDDVLTRESYDEPSVSHASTDIPLRTRQGTISGVAALNMQFATTLNAVANLVAPGESGPSTTRTATIASVAQLAAQGGTAQLRSVAQLEGNPKERSSVARLYDPTTGEGAKTTTIRSRAYLEEYRIESKDNTYYSLGFKLRSRSRGPRWGVKQR